MAHLRQDHDAAGLADTTDCADFDSLRRELVLRAGVGAGQFVSALTQIHLIGLIREVAIEKARADAVFEVQLARSAAIVDAFKAGIDELDLNEYEAAKATDAFLRALNHG